MDEKAGLTLKQLKLIELFERESLIKSFSQDGHEGPIVIRTKIGSVNVLPGGEWWTSNVELTRIISTHRLGEMIALANLKEWHNIIIKTQ